MLELIFLAIVGVVLLYLYMHEKDEIFKIAWLLSGLIIIFVASYININLNSISTAYPAYKVFTNSTLGIVNYSTIYTYYYLNATNSIYNLTDVFMGLNTSRVYPFTNITIKIPATSGHFKIAQFITDNNIPDLTSISKGLYQIHIHGAINQSFSQVKLYAQLWTINGSDNNEFMIGQSNNSTFMSNVSSEYILNFYNNQSVNISTSDRIALFVFANATASFGNPTNVSLYMGGIANSHISIPKVIAHAQITNTITAYTGYNTSANYKYGNSTSLNSFGIAFSGILILVGGIIGYRILEKLLKHFFK